MSKYLTVLTMTALILLTAISCGSASNSGAQSSSIPAIHTPEKIVGPGDQIIMPTSDMSWAPRMYGANEGLMLSQALKNQKSLMLILDRGFGDTTTEEQAYRMIKAASPNTAILARGDAILDTLLEERGEIPYRTTVEHVGSNAFGHPVFVPKDHPLHTEWLSKKKALKGADALLTIRKVTVNDQRLKELRNRKRGGCEKLTANLEQAISDNTALFDDLKNKLDKELEKAFATRLGYVTPTWKKELALASSKVKPGGSDAECLKALSNFVNKLDTCRESSCDLSPKFYPNAGGLVGMSEEETFGISERCLNIAPRNYVKETAAASADVVAAILPAISEEWGNPLQQLGALELIHTNIEKVCSVAHRRVSTNDLERMRGELNKYISTLSEQDISVKWTAASGQDRAPGVGPLRVFARARPVGWNAVETASKMMKQIKNMSKCQNGEEELLQVSIVEIGSSEVIFMGIFFREQLLCEDLAPGQP